MGEKKFTKDHEWIEINDNIGTVGITNNAQEQLGDVVFFELPEITVPLKRSFSLIYSSNKLSPPNNLPDKTFIRINWNIIFVHKILSSFNYFLWCYQSNI